MSDDARETRQERAPIWLRWLLIAIGIFSLGLGMLGVVLPGLPTTPFVLLAGACFVRASPTLHSWLLQTTWAGPMLKDWSDHRSLPRRTKRLALATMATTISISLWILHDNLHLQIVVLIAALIGAWVVWRIPTRETSESNQIKQK
ncbi:MAG: YbaN family protein [Burkholderiaceae bacterium]|nr:YbaN family protein [Burkholderiaceae bacterium]MCD8537066.1 YbaN family protein [Burkholderiaceae bacterium]MCD8564478.1 YbaN family protein [Burkholderiaceae bacterium]